MRFHLSFQHFFLFFISALGFLLFLFGGLIGSENQKHSADWYTSMSA